MTKPIEEILAPKPAARPRIHAYSIADAEHAGLLKVGQTTLIRRNDPLSERNVQRYLLGYWIVLCANKASMTGIMVLDDSDAPGSCKGACWFCAHKFPTFKRTCAAFPSGIPDEIWRGENPHTEPYPGDRGIHFERRQPKTLAGKSSGRKRPEP